MRNKKHISLLITAAIIVLEILPYGAVLNFGRPPEEGEAIRRTFSYFDLTPFGYANFAPFLTAIISCVMAVFVIVSIFNDSEIIASAIKVLAVAGFVISIMPLTLGMRYYTITAAIITAFFAAQFLLCSVRCENDDSI